MTTPTSRTVVPEQPLNEGPLDTLATVAKAGLQGQMHKALGRFSGNQQGRYQNRMVTSQLMRDYGRWLGQVGAAPDRDSLLKFLSNQFGANSEAVRGAQRAMQTLTPSPIVTPMAVANQANQANAAPGSASSVHPVAAGMAQPTTKPEVAPVAAKMSQATPQAAAWRNDHEIFYNKIKSLMSRQMSPATFAEAKSLVQQLYTKGQRAGWNSEEGQDARTKLQDLQRQSGSGNIPGLHQLTFESRQPAGHSGWSAIMQATRSVMRYAQAGHDTVSPKRTMAVLEQLRRYPDAGKVAEFRPMRWETRQQIVGFAMHLVEHDIRGKASLLEAYTRHFLVERPMLRSATDNAMQGAVSAMFHQPDARAAEYINQTMAMANAPGGGQQGASSQAIQAQATPSQSGSGHYGQTVQPQATGSGHGNLLQATVDQHKFEAAMKMLDVDITNQRRGDALMNKPNSNLDTLMTGALELSLPAAVVVALVRAATG